MLLRRTAHAPWVVAMLGCGGGAPLLHGAHALRQGEVQGGVGMSATVAGASTRRALDALGTSPASGNAGPASARAAALSAALAPGIAPWVGARVGLGSGNEAGLSYTGRAVRLDVRHAFERGGLALSVGAAASALLAHRDVSSAPDRWSLSPTSVGVDAPLLVGWRSAAGIVSLYGGGRAGFERVAGSVTLGTGGEGDPARDAALGHWYGGGLVGLTLGFRHVHGALELQATYHHLDGHVADLDIAASGVTWTPAAGLVATF